MVHGEIVIYSAMNKEEFRKIVNDLQRTSDLEVKTEAIFEKAFHVKERMISQKEHPHRDSLLVVDGLSKDRLISIVENYRNFKVLNYLFRTHYYHDTKSFKFGINVAKMKELYLSPDKSTLELLNSVDIIPGKLYNKSVFVDILDRIQHLDENTLFL